ncbi:hypothetical protein, partial [Ralstonia pseudosolanacearum]|uniref:hypothetical protein n=1 Tax=Ralstonia pseudosolanacearum TaxID=1310165 RepID=UPI003C798685
RQRNFMEEVPGSKNAGIRRAGARGAVADGALALGGNDATVEEQALVATVFPTFVELGATKRAAQAAMVGMRGRDSV